ncbi:hypothetical protein LCL86_11415 [Muricauda ruestringensis]|uniref:hypothetical protein n=1 Tax=Flagellimonas ruestringensis TaxID=111501 RepID=UPI001CD80E9F|nr:hypothetical protein [Allomuricauda ruestringensis]MCA0959656.1 hypothetical protein [Allomuricauda ruestringensis]
MKNLEALNLQELTVYESMNLDGGGKGKLLKEIVKWIGVYDAISDFKEGWDSVEPNC